MTRRRPRRAIFECPNCGADVPAGAKVCRECGSDDTTGWQSGEEIDYQSIDLPERDDDSDSGARPPRVAKRRGWSFWVAALLLAAIGVYALLVLSGVLHLFWRS